MRYTQHLYHILMCKQACNNYGIDAAPKMLFTPESIQINNAANYTGMEINYGT